VWYSWHGAHLTLQVKIRAGGRGTGVIGPHGDRLKVQVRAPAVDGKANAALLAFLAAEFRVPTNRIALVRGVAAPLKTLVIERPLELPKWLQMPSPPSIDR
jgi:uncharacterized protein (TIGR00251 family)